MESTQATADLEFVRTVMDRTQRRIDTHAFHMIVWGCIVLIWYPLGNYFHSIGNKTAYFALIPICLVLGGAIGGFLEYRRGKSPLLHGGNTFVSRQVVWVVWGTLAPAIVLSAVAPATGLIHGANVPILWGLAYANMAFVIGVIYSREFMISGIVIFIGAVAAMFAQEHNGYILGPFMGIGMMIPGWIAERRVRALRKEAAAA